MNRASARREKIFRPRAIPTKTGAKSIPFGLQAMRKWPARLKPMNPKEPSSTLRGRFVAGELQEHGHQSRRPYSGDLNARSMGRRQLGHQTEAESITRQFFEDPLRRRR